MSRKSRYTDAEWRGFFPVDGAGRSLISDTELAKQCRVTRQTVLAARRRLGIKSHREYVRATRGARSSSISVGLSARERALLDQICRTKRLSRSAVIGKLLAHPQVALLLELGAEVVIRILSEVSDDEVAI